MVEKLKSYIEEAGFDAALIISPENRFYFTGFESSDGYLIVTAEKSVFVTDGRYIEAAQKSVKNSEVVLQEKNAEQITKLFDSLGVKSVAVETQKMTLKEYTGLVRLLDGIEIVADGELDEAITDIRSVKEPWEVERIVLAQRIAEEAFSHILSFIKEGVTEKQIALELDYYMLTHGADALSFETIAVSGKNSSKPHGVPTEKAVEKGDFITMDFGAVVKGYHSDMTRTVALGCVSDEQQDVYNTVLQAQLSAMESVKSNVKCFEVDSAARDVIAANGYAQYFTHSTGHGVGVEIHEFPSLAPSCKSVLKAGNIITDEPGIYIPEKFGVRIEDMLFVTENGCENLTRVPKELIIL